MISDILNAMLGYVSLQDILQKIIQVSPGPPHACVHHSLLLSVYVATCVHVRAGSENAPVAFTHSLVSLM